MPISCSHPLNHGLYSCTIHCTYQWVICTMQTHQDNLVSYSLHQTQHGYHCYHCWVQHVLYCPFCAFTLLWWMTSLGWVPSASVQTFMQAWNAMTIPTPQLSSPILGLLMPYDPSTSTQICSSTTKCTASTVPVPPQLFGSIFGIGEIYGSLWWLTLVPHPTEQLTSWPYISCRGHSYSYQNVHITEKKHGGSKMTSQPKCNTYIRTSPTNRTPKYIYRHI